MSTGLLTQEDLQKWTGYTRPGDIERFCKEHGIKVAPAKEGQLCTTLAAVENAFNGKTNQSDFDDFEFKS